MIQFEKNELQVEPSRVHYLQCVTSLNIANETRTPAPAQKGCPNSSDIYRTDINKNKEIKTVATNLTGKVYIKDGFNCMTYQRYNNNIVISAAKGQGENLNTAQDSEFAYYSGEAKPTNSPFLSGGIPCNETVKAINGINKQNVPLIAGPGVNIKTEENIITISIDNKLYDSCDERNNSRAGAC